MGEGLDCFGKPAQAPVRVPEILIKIAVAIRFDPVRRQAMCQRSPALLPAERLVERQSARQCFERFSVPVRNLLRPLVHQDISFDPVQGSQSR